MREESLITIPVELADYGVITPKLNVESCYELVG